MRFFLTMVLPWIGLLAVSPALLVMGTPRVLMYEIPAACMTIFSMIVIAAVCRPAKAFDHSGPYAVSGGFLLILGACQLMVIGWRHIGGTPIEEPILKVLLFVGCVVGGGPLLLILILLFDGRSKMLGRQLYFEDYPPRFRLFASLTGLAVSTAGCFYLIDVLGVFPSWVPFLRAIGASILIIAPLFLIGVWAKDHLALSED